jgi:predicted choloylglycine hydrolase
MKKKNFKPRRISAVIIIGLLSVLVLGQCKSQNSIAVKANSFEGSAYEIGFQEGKLILESEPFFRNLLNAPVFTKTTQENFNQVCELLRKLDPVILDEMKGFADALTISYEDVVVKLSGYGITTPAIPNACTQIAVLPGNTADHHALVGRNYDFSADKYLTDFRLVMLSSDSFQRSIGTSQFVFGRIEGMNAAGLYAGMSFAHGKGRNEKGFFFPIIVRILLDQCKNTKEALALIQEIPHSCSYNYLIADKDSAFAVEVSPPKIAVRKPENNVLVAVNHYISNEMKAEQKKLLPNSVARLQLAVLKAPGINSIDTMKGFLSGHAGAGVCRHDFENYFGTLWSGIFDLNEVKAFYAFGPPCVNQYQVFDLKNEVKLNTTIAGTLPENAKIEPKGKD